MRHRFRILLLLAAIASGLVALSGLIDQWSGLGMASWKGAAFASLILSICGYVGLGVVGRTPK